ncbi:MAG: methyl-accepting chemotaxis protein [Gammaproteobacteria bacterium]
MAANRRYPTSLRLLVGLVVILLVLAAMAFFDGRPAATLASLDTTQELALLSQAFPNQAAATLRGELPALVVLEQSRARLSELIAELDEASGTARPDSIWRRMRDDIDIILSAWEQITLVHSTSDQISRLIPELLVQTGNLAAVLGPDSWAGFGRHIERFELAAQRMQQNVAALKSGHGDVRFAAQRIADDQDFLNQILRGLVEGDAILGIQPVTMPNAHARLLDVQSVQASVLDQTRSMVSASDGSIAAHLAGRQLAAVAEELSQSLASGGIVSGSESGTVASPSLLPFYLILAAMLPVLAMLAIRFPVFRIQEEPTIVQNTASDRNQRAILKLLDELGSLADGDLTVQATVTEDITGAIADSINYAIEALRELVITINETAVMISGAARQTRETAMHQTQASETQSKQIAAATDSIQRMAASIEEVSGNAERSADVARHSVDVAHKGGEAVRRTIHGMNTIRETIQDTAKRIKRLGESSQEIGNIVELINDIAEQTNVLALNASIQASMAGDAGRGFAVVADEVQRLAERSANATKQIEMLVKTIQSDTKEAVVSMERSTTDVVGGALLAENAGAALDEIDQVSNQIAALVQNISSSARQQATAAANISRNMGVVREISAQTAEATGATFSSISTLADLASQLRTTVSGFRLPEGQIKAAPPTAAVPAKTAKSKTAKDKTLIDKQAKSSQA